MSQAMFFDQPRARPRQTFRVGYDMPAMDIRAGKSFQAHHYAAVRSRLLGARPKQMQTPIRKWSYAPAPLPSPPSIEIPTQPSDRISWRAIVARVAHRHSVAVADILGKSRSKAVARARHEAIYHVIVETGWTLPVVGRRFGRDATTVLHSFQMHEKILQSEAPPMRDMILTGVREGATIEEKCRELVELIAVKYGVSPAQIYGNQRRADLHQARKEIFLTLYLDHGLNYSQIGKCIGDRDHNTIIYAIGDLVGPRSEDAHG